MNTRTIVATAITAIALTATAAPAALAFVDPGSWDIGDDFSTYQHWDVVTADTGNLPDVGSFGPGADSTWSVTPPGFATGSGNFYAFAGPYGSYADLAGYDSGPAGSGTHVIVQIVASLGEGGMVGLFPDSVQLLDAFGGTPLDGGANADLLRSDVLTTYDGDFGGQPITIEERIFEFYLPEFVGDFTLDLGFNASAVNFELRVDTILADGPLPITPIPAPGAIAAFGLAGLGLGARSRRA